MKAEIRFPRFVNHETVFAAEGALAAALSLRHAEILPRYPGESLCETCFPSLVEFLRRRSAAVNGTFDGAACRLAGERLTVSLSHGGLNILRTTKTDDLLRRMIREMFGRPIELHIEGAEETDTASEHYKAMMEQAERDAAAARQEAATRRRLRPRRFRPPRLRPPLRARRQEKPKPGKPVDPARPPVGGLPIYLETAQMVFGPPIRERPAALNTLEADGSWVTVWGEVFSYETRDNRDGTKTRHTFNITDNTSSITVSIWADNKKDKDKLAALEAVKPGVCILVNGKYDYDEYAKNNILRPKSIAVVAKFVKQDNASEKRVELHMHTKMSAMDGVSEAADLVARAASWGHKAVAITDHGVVQAFPDAMNAAAKCRKKGQNIKILYGVEAYYINDSIPVVAGDAARALRWGIHRFRY